MTQSSQLTDPKVQVRTGRRGLRNLVPFCPTLGLFPLPLLATMFETGPFVLASASRFEIAPDKHVMTIPLRVWETAISDVRPLVLTLSGRARK